MRALLCVGMLIASAAGVAHADPDALAQEVAHVRGLKLKVKIPTEVVDRAELRRRLDVEAAEAKTAALTAAQGLALQRWGFVPLDYAYGARLIDLLADQIAGYYDSRTKQLTIVEGADQDPAWADMVLAHELDHALQDQAFDLQKFEKLPDEETDAVMARHALVEGDGVALMLEVILGRQGEHAPWAVPEAAAAVVESMNVPDGVTQDAFDAAPLAIREQMIFPYRDGFAFVAALRRTRPWSAIDAVFRRPPRSTEQILHVEKYLADEKPIAVTSGASPLADYFVFESEVWGELGTRSFLEAHGVAPEVARIAAAGWGGDRAIVLAKAGETNARRGIGVARLEWDTEADAREAQAAFERALDEATVGATVSQTMEATRWLALDGTVSSIERQGSSIVIVIGAPVELADQLDGWTLMTVTRAGTARGRSGG